MYLDGWLANTVHPTISGWGTFDHDVWELYHLAEDRAQRNGLADEHPEKLKELVERWWHDAGVYKGLPIDDRTVPELLGTSRPQPSEPRDRYVYCPGTSPVPESVAADLRGRSFAIAPALWPNIRQNGAFSAPYYRRFQGADRVVGDASVGSLAP